MTDDFRPTDAGASDSLRPILDRRRGLLTELFFLSKYADVPQEYDGEEGASLAATDAEDLKAFLEQNDLELYVQAVPPDFARPWSRDHDFPAVVHNVHDH